MEVIRHSLLGPPDDRLIARSAINTSLALAASVVAVAAATAIVGPPEPSSYEAGSLTASYSLLGTVIAAPIIETLLLTGLLALLVKFRLSLILTALVSAALWAVAHEWRVPFSSVGTFPGFFVDSCAYLVWRQRSYWHGLGAAALQHTLHNAVVLGAVVALGGL